MVTLDDLTKIMPTSKTRASVFLEPLNLTMQEFCIITPLQVAAFLSQVAHESCEFLYMEELASGEAYEGRHDLGNTQAGDGKLYKGATVRAFRNKDIHQDSA